MFIPLTHAISKGKDGGLSFSLVGLLYANMQVHNISVTANWQNLDGIITGKEGGRKWKRIEVERYKET